MAGRLKTIVDALLKKYVSPSRGSITRRGKQGLANSMLMSPSGASKRAVASELVMPISFTIH